MTIFEIEKDDLLQLSAEKLEELIARLAEAEVKAGGYSPSYVHWSGPLTAPDRGIDIHVQLPDAQWNSGFIPKSDTIFQAKKHSMSVSPIRKEMQPKGKLLPIISEQAEKGGVISSSVWTMIARLPGEMIVLKACGML
ncbi:hypothetical protein PT277_03960 [Acetobacteraceae bacterium ESL0709]|nr:hypothetical protein [Acetobacteraceae bacterium ESL0697]MDF7677853.1 hypothetical protein [Acetobacteraceae bacterium ESL0709]